MFLYPRTARINLYIDRCYALCLFPDYVAPCKTKYFILGVSMKIFKKHSSSVVFCIENGEGEIRNIIKLYDGLEDYFKVRFLENEQVKYYPVNGKDQVRGISSHADLELALLDLGNKLNDSDFHFEYLVYQRYMLEIDIDFVINIIASLSNKSTLLESDKLLLAQCLESLILEVSQVYDVDNDSAKGIVSDHMRCA